MKEYDYEKILNINTSGEQQGYPRSLHYHPYQPTPYSALETLFSSYEVKSTDRVVDFGCGKGRLSFFIHYYYHASVIGVEVNKIFYLEAMNNKMNYKKRNQAGLIEFHQGLAQEYPIDPYDNRFYFFNPFSLEIFIQTIHNILSSLEKDYRDMELILYYSSEEYMLYLDNNTPFELKREIQLPGISKTDPYERFLIYSLDYV
ncbi:class I SAM-dependent methyltransferase [Virgibacillus xinjiangensis]|uniref:Class I SAM-dependent methyltransferase n=1 Tax=Virgibacillus xinjiangensis TaxID=393090 RepID=A0ABV7CZY4_9BACI